VSEWFATFFDRVANDFWDAVMPAGATGAEADYLLRTLHLSGASTVLDVPSGRGRHALVLARAGVHVVAVDMSSDAVAVLGQRAGEEGLRVDARLGDMRALDVGPVDAAYSFGNSVGYFGPDGMGRFLGGVADAVRPGGRFVVDTSMVAEVVLPQLELAGIYEAGGITMTDRRRYDPRTSRLDATVTFEQDGAVESREMSEWIVTSGELVRRLEAAGFQVDDLHADLDGTPFHVGAGRLLAVARRP
jgi:SAM-dependent methyltransferase